MLLNSNEKGEVMANQIDPVCGMQVEEDIVSEELTLTAESSSGQGDVA